MKTHKVWPIVLVCFLAFSMFASLIPISKAVDTGISRVQGNYKASGTGITLNVTLGTTPTVGNMLVIAIFCQGSSGITVSKVNTTGVTWVLAAACTSEFFANTRSEIWAGVVNSVAGINATVTFTGSTNAILDICEYSGLKTSGYLDKTASQATNNYYIIPTGTTATTTQYSELEVAAIGSWQDTAANLYDPINGFSMLDGIGVGSNALAFMEKIVLDKEAAFTHAETSYITHEQGAACIATFKASHVPPALTIYSATGGTTSPGESTTIYTYGSTVTITATESDSHYFSHWMVNGTNAGSDNPLSFSITGDTKVNPQFSASPIDSGVAYDIERVQGPIRNTTTGTAISVTLDSTPISGNILIAGIGMQHSSFISVASITQTGVTWVLGKQEESFAYLASEIWVGTVGAGASSTLTVNLAATASSGAIANVAEYHGLNGTIDQTAAQVGSTTNPKTGTTATTTLDNELCIGVTTTNNMVQTTGTGINGFLLEDGAIYSGTATTYLERVVNETDTYTSSPTVASLAAYAGCIVTFFGNPLTFYITSSSDAHSTISPNGVASVISGNDQSYLIGATTGYVIAGVTVDGVAEGALSAYTFPTVEENHTITVTSVVYSAATPSIVGSSSQRYYFRSDLITTLGETGYRLDSDYTNTAASLNNTFAGNDTVDLAVRIYLFSSPVHSTELTSGPSGIISIPQGNYATAYSSSFVIPETTVQLGYQALQVDVLERANGSAWVTVSSFVSPVLMTDKIELSTWKDNFYVVTSQSGGSTNVGLFFDSKNYATYSYLSGISLHKPDQSAIQAWRLSRNDIIGFELGAYTDIIGPAFYVLLILGIAGVFYLRTANFGMVVFLFVMFGGANSFLFVLLPGWVLPGLAAFLILGVAFIIWRVMHQ
jgi:hypothetical protein